MKIIAVSMLAIFCLICQSVGESAMAGEDFISKMVPQISSQTELLTTGDSRPWKAPDFSGQNESLGYSENAFSIPKGMEKQVQFWVDVYTKYDSTQGIIHDSDDIDKIYEVVDLKDIESNRARQKKINLVKKEIAERLHMTKSEKSRLRYQLGQKDMMLDAIFYSGRYLEDMEKIFRDAKLPVELTRLAFVESSFNVLARSKVGASGIWQIMKYTARPYRMVSSTVDKRNHPLEATKLAAKLLRNNYVMLESWPLAVTGWNHGPSGVKKMTKSYGTHELATLIENVNSRRSFGFASRNFYASFLAALEVERNANKYYGSLIVRSKTLESQDVKLPVDLKYKDLVTWFDGDNEKAQIYNPHLTSLVVRKGRRIPASTVISIPKDKLNEAMLSFTHKDHTEQAAR